MWYVKYGWKDNPFSVKYSTDLVGFDKEKSALINYVSSGDMCAIVGEPGAGKTSLLKWLQRQLNIWHKGVYLNGEYVNENFNLKRHVGSPWLRKRVLLLDEAHQCDEPFMKDTKALWDANHIKSVIIAQIGYKMDYPDSLNNRVGGRIVRLSGMGFDEAKQLITMRTRGSNPFSDEVLELVINDAKNNPRKILENCELLCMKLDVNKITPESAKQVLSRKKADSLLELQSPEDVMLPDNLMPLDSKKLAMFSPMQQRMVRLLLEGNRTAKQMAEIMNTTEGSIGKQLSSLGEKQVVFIVNSRRPKVYGLTAEFKTSFN